jgi:hypothetical protein
VTLGGYWINDYRKPPACRQEQTNRCDDLVEGFFAAMRARGHQPKVLRREGAASPKQWQAGTDTAANGVDTVAFAYLATHGGLFGKERGGGAGWVHWATATFNSVDGCRFSTVVLNASGNPANLNSPTAALTLGDASLRWAVLDSCRSLQVGHVNEKKLGQDPDRANQLRDAMPDTTWRRCFGGVHILFGFTGLSSDAFWTDGRGTRFGKRAGAGEPLADSWLDEAYSSACDDAPVAVAWGRSADDSRRRLYRESLANPEPTLTPAEITHATQAWRS